MNKSQLSVLCSSHDVGLALAKGKLKKFSINTAGKIFLNNNFSLQRLIPL